jgi:methionyl-tRNA synthetase
VEKLSGDLCISRPKSRLDWGIELPFDKDFVTYVWFDALTNYISFAGYDPAVGEAVSFPYNAQPQEFRDKWPALQIIGKDILVPAHGIYWLIMLHAIGFPDDQMPQLLVHGWWNIGGAKMSKSVGNIVDPFVLADTYSADALRYYLMSDIVTGQDADFSEERLIDRYNADLANSLGNLLNRTLTMVGRYQGDRIELPKGAWLQNPDERSTEFYAEIVVRQIKAYESHMSAGRTFPITFPITFGPFVANAAIGNILSILDQANALVESAAPWKLAKDLEGVSKTKLNAVLYALTETLRIIAILISPVLPQAAHGIFDQLNWKMELSGKEERFSLSDAGWGRLPDGHVVGKPVPLFPRIETTG